MSSISPWWRPTIVDGFGSRLAWQGIATAIHYPVPIHETPAYTGAVKPSLPGVGELARRVLSLPLYPAMMDTEIDQVAEAVHSFRYR